MMLTYHLKPSLDITALNPRYHPDDEHTYLRVKFSFSGLPALGALWAYRKGSYRVPWGSKIGSPLRDTIKGQIWELPGDVGKNLRL